MKGHLGLRLKDLSYCGFSRERGNTYRGTIGLLFPYSLLSLSKLWGQALRI